MPSAHHIFIYALVFLAGYLASEFGPDLIPGGKHY